MVYNAWKSFVPPKGSKMYQFQQKLKFPKRHIKNWNLSLFGNIFQEKNILEQKMADVQQEIINVGRSELLASKEQDLQKQL